MFIIIIIIIGNLNHVPITRQSEQLPVTFEEEQ